ncbi:aldehyde dehydrogenase [Sulfitobacter pontiacus]|uniref:aldehyde dehydrogenase family protein n=1 Tax=Sulfitobacter pontiacus TaxID=60137 RepID=UPI0007DA2FBD|nr:aldehyde dehydrogenase family protein [Sulfitobacter pontiacus]OAN82142.1 aldehyde dehydrogenase [Sulfitobacter pontiacus]
MTEQAQIDTLRTKAIAPRKLLIDGQLCDSETGETDNVISPLDGSVLTTTAAGSKGDTERAIAAARRAFDDKRWRGMPPAARKKIMLRWAELIEAEMLDLAVLGVRNNGTEIGMALKAEPGSAIATLRFYAEAIDKVYGEIAPTPRDILGLIHREPIGVVAAIIPWNFPLMIGAWKLGPALAAGNSVVLKPSETASLSLLRVAELALEAGLPAGVLNVVTGEGRVVGEALSHSMDVDVVVFTGSGATGRRLLQASAASNMKRCYLELGGKSANVVFADAKNLTEAAAVSAAGIFRNSGQVCVAGSRLLVERSVHDDFVAELAKAARSMRVGDPLDLTTQAGAINNATQLAQNLSFVETAQAEGGTLYQGGQRVLEDTGGYFMEPTIITDVAAHHSVAQKEVFGPVLAVTAFEDEDDAIRLANSTDYGLAGGVWTSDLSRAHRMVREMHTGVVHVNTYGGPDVTVPMGGVKQSGNGHDKSLHALDKFLDLKTAWVKL